MNELRYPHRVCKKHGPYYQDYSDARCWDSCDACEAMETAIDEIESDAYDVERAMEGIRDAMNPNGTIHNDPRLMQAHELLNTVLSELQAKARTMKAELI